jgi:prophage tail gpP-like protein
MPVFSLPQYPNPLEIAEITVVAPNGMRFSDWETVWIQHRWADSSALFRFSTAERETIPDIWTKLQLKPGAWVNITLGGVKAIANGIITDRQVAYDANSHGVQLSGRSYTWVGFKSSVDKKPNNSFDNMTLYEIASTLMGRYGVKVNNIGQDDHYKFPQAQPSTPAETIWDFLESLARVRGAVMGSDFAGTALIIWPHSNKVIGSLIEGVNILSCQCVISIANLFGVYVMLANKPASDQSSGTQASEIEKSASGTGYGNILATAPVPLDEGATQTAADAEKIWSEGTKIQATVMVQGWFVPESNPPLLWVAGMNVKIISPMCILNQVLSIQTVTFMQDRQGGTKTQLDLVIPWLLRDTIADIGPWTATTGPVDPNAREQPAGANGPNVTAD